ncbi:MAG: HEPN domain-containing protein [Leptospirales bacterium]|nr:HEPN domain-containing protein [Leptospirales bacterium]
MKKQVEDWILLADKDLYAAEILLKGEYSLTNIVAFHCQQVIEKYLKAFLIEKDVPLIKTHDLIKLNGMVNEIKNIGIDEKKLIVINEIYVESRYPGDIGLLPDGMPTFDEAKEFLGYAREVKTIINNELRR